MNIINRYWLISCILCLLSASVSAQDIPAYGSVRGQNQPNVENVPPDWTARITEVDSDSHRMIRTITSNGSSFLIKIPTNKIVDLIFSSPGYNDFNIHRINTENVQEYRVRPTPVVLSTIASETTLIKGPGVYLQIGRENALITGDIDILLYNVEEYRNVYRENAPALDEINQFEQGLKTDPQFSLQLTPERERNWKIYKEMVNPTQGRVSTFLSGNNMDAGELLGLIKDVSVFSGIRAKVTDKYLSILQQTTVNVQTTVNIQSTVNVQSTVNAQTTLVPQVNQFERARVREQALAYFRIQARDSNSGLFIPALIALAKIGNDTTDKQIVLENLGSENYDRQIAALRAVNESQLTIGVSVLKDLAKSETDTPSKRYATQTLENNARNHVASAIDALNEVRTIEADRIRSAESQGAPRQIDIRTLQPTQSLPSTTQSSPGTSRTGP